MAHLRLVMIIFVCGPVAGRRAAATEYEWPGEPQGRVCRTVSWNVELLGTRNPPRTAEQLAALGARMASLDASLLVLQEIFDVSVLEEVCGHLPGSWELFYAGSEHAFVYNADKVILLRGERLSQLSNEPYTTYPGKESSRPLLGVFRAAGTCAAPFCIVGIHCKANDPDVQRAEGEWILNKVEELLEAGCVPDALVVVGDTNGEPDAVPSTELERGGLLVRLPNMNGDETDIRGRRVDHCHATAAAYTMVRGGKAFIVPPGYYGESRSEFYGTYSDHYPLLFDLVPAGGGVLREFADLASHWRRQACSRENGRCGFADMNADGVVDLWDLEMAAGLWVGHEVQ